MNDKEIKAQIVRWCKAVTGVKTIQAWPDANRPDGEYLVVEFLTGPRDVRQLPSDYEYEELTTTNSQGNLEINAIPVIYSEWKFSIKSYRFDDCMAPIRALRSRAKMQGPQLELHPLLTIHKIGTPNNVPEKINQEWEQRAHALLYVRGYTRDGFLIDVINEAPVTVAKT